MADDLAQRGSRGVLGEDPPDDDGFGLVDLEAGRAGVGAGDPPIPVGHLPEDGLAGSHPIQLAPPVALRDLRPFVLGDHALHLDEQPRLGVVVDGWRVGEDHGHAETGELVDDQNLVGERPGEPVR
ncbi:MAG TPA: hypothetical protein VNF71_15005 [Acidimicrobiales bacterium]|nr:hypothetical protein [Acidimicrobiales bacterium]